MANFTSSKLLLSKKEAAVPWYVAARCASVVYSLPKVTAETFGEYVNQLFLVCRDGWRPICGAWPEMAELYREVFLSYYAPWVAGPTPPEACSSLMANTQADGFSPAVKAWLFAAIYFHELTFWGHDIGSATEAWLKWPRMWHCCDPTEPATAVDLDAAKELAVFEHSHLDLGDWVKAIKLAAQTSVNAVKGHDESPASPADLVVRRGCPDEEPQLQWLLNEAIRYIELIDQTLEARKEAICWLESRHTKVALSVDAELRTRLTRIRDSDPEPPPALLEYLPWPSSMVVWAQLLGGQRTLENLTCIEKDVSVLEAALVTRITSEGEIYRCYFRDLKLLFEETRDKAFERLDDVRRHSPPALLTPRGLATKYRLPEEALRKRLDRWRTRPQTSEYPKPVCTETLIAARPHGERPDGSVWGVRVVLCFMAGS